MTTGDYCEKEWTELQPLILVFMNTTSLKQNIWLKNIFWSRAYYLLISCKLSIWVPHISPLQDGRGNLLRIVYSDSVKNKRKTKQNMNAWQVWPAAPLIKKTFSAKSVPSFHTHIPLSMFYYVYAKPLSWLCFWCTFEQHFLKQTVPFFLRVGGGN